MISAVIDLRTQRLDLGVDEHLVVDAALACIGRWGLAKTTLDDIAREAGISRATVYRRVSGGKAGLVALVGERETARLIEQVCVAVDEAPDLASAVVGAVTAVSQGLRSNTAFAYLLQHEPHAVLPYLSFDELNPVIGVGRLLGGTHLTRFLSSEAAAEVGEWIVRLVVSFILMPGPADLCNEGDVDHLVRTFLLPGIDGT